MALATGISLGGLAGVIAIVWLLALWMLYQRQQRHVRRLRRWAGSRPEARPAGAGVAAPQTRPVTVERQLRSARLRRGRLRAEGLLPVVAPVGAVSVLAAIAVSLYVHGSSGGRGGHPATWLAQPDRRPGEVRVRNGGDVPGAAARAASRLTRAGLRVVGIVDDRSGARGGVRAGRDDHAAGARAATVLGLPLHAAAGEDAARGADVVVTVR